MALNSQVHLYSVDTSYFYNTKEKKIHDKLNAMYIQRKFETEKLIPFEEKDDMTDEEISEIESIKLINKPHIDRISYINSLVKKEKAKLQNKLDKNNKKRKLRSEMIRKKDIISVFDSTLTRTIGCSSNEISTDILIVQTYYFQVAESLITKGFTWNGEEYVVYTASAGQIRLKKFVALKKSVFDRIKPTLMCGLTEEIINEKGGVNTNKYLAYLALNNSATEIWEGFDIDRCIVVDDFETNVKGLVDYIDYETYKISYNQEMDIPIPHTDGAGIMLPQFCNRNRMVRFAWHKGLLIPFPFDKFIKENLNKYPNASKVKDIYGKEYDIFEDNIQVILTKSQFKMYKYYDSWDDYKEKFKKYNCEVGYCNEEVDNPPFAQINYQMMQTLTDVTDDELKIITEPTVKKINDLGYNKGVMLKILGADKRAQNKNFYQKSLEIYPELLQDDYSKEVLKDMKKSLVKNAKSGKLFLDSHYTFICPDVYAFAQWLFLGDKNPSGLLEANQVSCKLYKRSNELAVLRSPHLWREWNISENIVNSKLSKWFVTNGIYVSSHSLISKLLMFDVDGDSALICNDPTLINVAKRNMKGILPIHYEMKKANSENLNPNSIYNGLANAYRNTTIGIYSNNITKVWNDSEPNLDVIRLLCMESNFSIDSAKTLFFIQRPENEDNLIRRYTKSKVPHFFVHAKGKKEKNVERIQKKTTMGRIEKLIPNSRLVFKKNGLSKFDYTMLMSNKGVILDDEIIEKYKELIMDASRNRGKCDSDERNSHMDYLSESVRNELLRMRENPYEVLDVLIAHLFGKSSKDKLFFWSAFGDMIFENIQNNIKKRELDNTITCEVCGKRVEKTTAFQLYCNDCKRHIKLENDRKIRRNSYILSQSS